MTSHNEIEAALQRLIARTATEADRQILERALETRQIALATGDQAVAVGGDVRDAVIVIGDHNIVFKGVDAETIRQAMCPPLALDQLPPDITDFTGRERELDQITCYLRQTLQPGRTALPVFSVIGMPGVGKSALATRAAHVLKERFPDAQLYVDLRGAEGQSLEPLDALATFLRALGVGDNVIPKGLRERAGLYRGLLSGKRALVLLDNAKDETQVRPLFPGGPPCAVMITSREPLSALDGTESLKLGVMTELEAWELLQKLTGRERVLAEPEAARNIVVLCGRLPLAIRIAGGKLKSKPHWRLEDYVSRLADERRRLEQLQLKDLDIRASFALSYQDLESQDARFFRLLGLLPGPKSVQVAAALLDTDQETAQDASERLVDMQLLEPTNDRRYRFHDLVLLFARERLEDEPVGEQQAARLRAIRWYLLTSADMDERLRPEVRRQESQALAEKSNQLAVEVGPEMLEALDWFEAERINLTAAVEWALQAEQWEMAWQLARNLVSFFNIRGYWADWEHSHKLALEAARKVGDRRAAGMALTSLGIVYRLESRWDEAIKALEESLHIAQELRDLGGEGLTRAELGIIDQLRGRRREAITMFEESLGIYRELGDRVGESMVLNLLGNAYRLQDQLDKAVATFEESLQINQSLDDPYGRSIALNLLGAAYRLQGRWEEAIAKSDESLCINRQLGNRQGEGIALNNLGTVYRLQGHWDKAIETFEESLRIARSLRNLRGESIGLNNLGNAYRLQGRWNEAIVRLEGSRRINQTVGDRYGQGIAVGSLGNIYRMQGRWDKAIAMLEESLRISDELNDRRGKSIDLNNLALVYCLQGRLDEAMDKLKESLALESADPRGKSITFRIWGEVCAQKGQLDESMAKLKESLCMARQLKDPRCQGQTLNSLGDVYNQQGRWEEARQCLEEALGIVREMGDSHGEGLVMKSLAALYLGQGQMEKAVDCWQQARARLCAESPEYEQVTQLLGLTKAESSSA